MRHSDRWPGVGRHHRVGKTTPILVEATAGGRCGTGYTYADLRQQRIYVVRRRPLDRATRRVGLVGLCACQNENRPRPQGRRGTVRAREAIGPEVELFIDANGAYRLDEKLFLDVFAQIPKLKMAAPKKDNERRRAP